MAKINTVNVIEMADDDLLSITSFTDDEAGNKEAEARFQICAQENGCDPKESFIEDGYFEQGNYQLFISHSV